MSRARLTFGAELLAIVCAIAASAIAAAGATRDAAAHASEIGSLVIDVANLHPAKVSEAHALDVLAAGGSHVLLAGRTIPVEISRGEPIEIDGWAVDREAGRPSAAVYVEIEGRVYAAPTGIERDDVARALKSSSVATAGFALHIPADVFAGGTQHVVVRGVSADRKSSYEIGPQIEVMVSQ